MLSIFLMSSRMLSDKNKPKGSHVKMCDFLYVADKLLNSVQIVRPDFLKGDFPDK